MKRFLLFLISAAAFCQTPPASIPVVHVLPAETLKVAPGKVVKAPLTIQVDAGYHVNSNKPSDRFLIPLQLTWQTGPLESTGVIFPKPEQGKFSFSAKPVSVFTGSIAIVTQFRAAPGTKPGLATASGKLRYQACDEHSCLTPRTVDVTLPLEIVN